MADQEAQNSQMNKVGSVARRRQFFAALAATLGPFSLGSVLAWKLDLQSFPEPTEAEYKLVVTTALMGGILSGPVAGILIEKFGRKRVLILASVLLTLGWFLVAVGVSFSEIIVVTHIGRFLTGLGGGSSVLAAIAYISEFADAKRRGLLLCLVQIMIVCGDLFVNFLHLISYHNIEKLIAYLSTLFPAGFLILAIYLRESPRFLVKKGRTDDAVNCISWFRATSLQDYAVKEELEAISKSHDATKTRKPGCCGRVFIRPILRPLSLAIHCIVMVQMCGVVMILEEKQSLLFKSGFNLNSYMTNVILALVMITFTVLTALIIDCIGRRTMIIGSGFIMSFSLVVLGTFYYFNQENFAQAITSVDYGWIPISCTFLFLIGFSIGIGPLPWVIIGEILPPGSKGYCLAPLISVWFLNNYASSALDPSKKFAFHWRLWLYGGVCLFGTLQILCTLPETKKKTLEKIEQFFASKKPSSKRANISTLSVHSRRPESTTLLTPPGFKSKWENGNGRT